jgi:hypothetical protein
MTANPLRQLIARLPELNNFQYNLIKQNTEDCYMPTIKDSLFFNTQFPILGLLADTTDNYKILYLQHEEDFYPYLRTFSKNGQIIDDQYVSYGDYTDWECAMDSCKSIIKLLDASTIERYIRMRFTECDSLGNKIPSTTKIVIKRQTIKVDKKGKITYGIEQDN